MFKRIEGYFRPVLVQVQWCLSLLTLINTMFLVFGTPSWIKELYAGFGIMTLFWLVYYFKRGRRREFANIVEDNPIYDEVREIKRILEQQNAGKNNKIKTDLVDFK